MKILTSKLYERQLKEILEPLSQQDYQQTRNFKMYLDTIILNMPSKIKKYKKSIYFDDENIKDIEYKGCTIIFFFDEQKSACVVLGITKKS
ncbi:hypothetical protein [Sulfurimonas sp.]|uniref:hypothetical protein n=1 Tax=Sulfurimonas sp. TaxID=2022749 RepID=UPI002AAFFC11|nr:hypothetical protein [Sulfurimonas sp.]